MKLTKNGFLRGFAATVLLLALVRIVFPGVAEVVDSGQEAVDSGQLTGDSYDYSEQSKSAENSDASGLSNSSDASEVSESSAPLLFSARPHAIRSVANYQTAFPDTNSVQLAAARRWGVSPVRNREDAEARKRELVYIGSSPYYHVDPLSASIPYLVPRAALLLQDIGEAFFDSLAVKQVPLHRIIVTSVLRSQDDVARLRRINHNATENSCHLYGTTVDICYNRYETVQAPDGPARRAVRNDTLKWVLSEVLRDMRERERCYIKYEVKQGCFHLTVR